MERIGGKYAEVHNPPFGKFQLLSTLCTSKPPVWLPLANGITDIDSHLENYAQSPVHTDQYKKFPCTFNYCNSVKLNHKEQSCSPISQVYVQLCMLWTTPKITESFTYYLLRLHNTEFFYCKICSGGTIRVASSQASSPGTAWARYLQLHTLSLVYLLTCSADTYGSKTSALSLYSQSSFYRGIWVLPHTGTKESDRVR